MFTSGFQNLLRKLKADPKAVVWFMVYKDSIDTYHAVREVTDQLGLPAGWELAGASTITRWISDEYVVNFTPVAAPPPPGGPAPAVTIAPPKATLD
jgi:hypothetical protein